MTATWPLDPPLPGAPSGPEPEGETKHGRDADVSPPNEAADVRPLVPTVEVTTPTGNDPVPSVLGSRLIAALAIIYAIYWSRAVLMPATIAILLAFILRPAVRRLRRYHVPEAVTAAALLLGLMGLAIGATSSVIGPVTTWLEEAPEELSRLRDKLRSVQNKLRNLSQTTARVQELAQTSTERAPVAVTIQQSELSTNLAFASSTVDWLGTAVVVLVLTFFLLTSGDRLLNQVLTILPTTRDKRRTVELVYGVEAGINRYLVTVTAINVGLGVCTAVIMGLLGLPNPLMWGALAAVFNYVPFFGAIAGTITMGFAALIAFDSVTYALLIPIAFVLLTTVEGNFLTPMILGHSIALNPIVVFASLMFWGWMWGLGGIILAVPLLTITKLVTEAFETTTPVARLISA